MATKQQLLEALYNDPMFGLHGKTKMTQKIKQGLEEIDTLQIHKPVWERDNRKFYGKENAKGPLVSIQMDLTYLQDYKRDNDNIPYLIVCIDVYSRYIWVVKAKDRTKENWNGAIDYFFEKMGKIPENITSDNELNKRWFIEKMRQLSPNTKLHFTDPGEKYKTGMVERVNRTLKDMIKRYMTGNDTLRYIDQLRSIVYNYNNTYHSRSKTTPYMAFNNIESPSIQSRPPEAPPNEEFLSEEQNQERKNLVKQPTENLIGKKVRIRKKKEKFTRTMDREYSFTIYEVISKIDDRFQLRNLETGKINEKLFNRSQLQIIPDETNEIKDRNKDPDQDEQPPVQQEPPPQQEQEAPSPQPERTRNRKYYRQSFRDNREQNQQDRMWSRTGLGERNPYPSLPQKRKRKRPQNHPGMMRYSGNYRSLE